MRRWRKEPIRSAGGTSWRLVAGRDADRIRLNLSRVTEGQAERALARLQQLEADGEGRRVVELFAEDPEQGARFLVGDHPAERVLLPDPAPDYRAMTLAEYFDAVFWPARIDPDSAIAVAASTAETEEGFWRHKGGLDGKGARRGILDGELGATLMRDLDDQAWERWQESQTQLSSRSKVLRRNAYAVLLAWARRKGHISYRPEFFRIKGSTKKTRALVDPLDLDEVSKLLDATVRAATPELAATRRAMWAVGVGQGLRPSELVRVCWEDVDWTAKVLKVRGTKTEAAADSIPMTMLAHRELRVLWMRLGQPAKGRAFLYDGEPIAEYKRSLASDAKAAGIGRKVTPYLLRHSFATIAWSLGIEKDVTRRIGRWTTNRMLDEVYTRPRPASMVAKVAGFDF